MSGAPICLIDASIYIFRYYFSLPDRWFDQHHGYGTAAVYGYTGFLLSLLEAHRPSHVAACFDESLGSGFRHQLYPAYKSSRVLPDAALAFQLQACREASELLGIASFASDLYEADDLLGSLYHYCGQQAAPVAVLTRDKDLAQVLTRPEDYLWDYSAQQRYYHADIIARFGVPPDALVDYLALVGDSSDDIPGVPGVGPKTAAALLMAFGSLEALWLRRGEIANLPLRGAGTLAAKLEAFRPQIALAQQLARIKMDIDLVSHFDDLRHKAINIDDFSEFCTQMGWGQTPARRAAKLLPPEVCV
ncbi:MAG TPA: 5'-3' exonuclease H3TH domain-containing protein [Marinobacter sp.]|nr:5'-3' exonuclease H3TH domain-containing protein [Marinobacter sp.]